MTTPFQYFSYDKDNVLSTEGVSLVEIAEKIGTPAYVYSTKGFIEPFRLLKKELAELDALICFAVKSNSNIAVLKLLAEEGAGVDLVSGGELYRAKAANIPGERIVFSGVGKIAAEIKMALDHPFDHSSNFKGIYSFNVESIQELNMINEVALKSKTKAKVALRFNPDINAKTHRYISTGLKKNKFGMNFEEIISIVDRLSQLKGITLAGISIHIGSQLLSLSPLKDAFIKLTLLITKISPKLEIPLEFVDLGGGIGITYENEKAPKLKAYCQLIKKYFGDPKKLRRYGLTNPIKILIEPGRALSGNAGVLLSSVLYKKDRKTKEFIIIDSGMNDLIRPALYESFHEIYPLVKNSSDKKRIASVFGPVCESADCFASERVLPSKLEAGELVAILSAGAYGFSMASNYNSRPKPAEVLVSDGKFRVIRKRETYEDLLRGEIL